MSLSAKYIVTGLLSWPVFQPQKVLNFFKIYQNAEILPKHNFQILQVLSLTNT